MSGRSGGVAVAAACAATSATVAATGRLRCGRWLWRFWRVDHADRYIIRCLISERDLYNFDRKLCIGGALCAGLVMRVCGAGQIVDIRLPRDASIGSALRAGLITCVRYNSLTVKVYLPCGAGIVGACLPRAG